MEIDVGRAQRRWSPAGLPPVALTAPVPVDEVVAVRELDGSCRPRPAERPAPGRELLRLALALVALLWGGITQQIWLGAVAAALVLLIDFGQPLALKNVFIAYVFLLFGVSGAHYYPDDSGLVVDLLVFASAFLVGYHLLGRRGGGDATVPRLWRPRSDVPVLARLLTALLVVRCLYTLYWAVFVFGGAYLNGAALVQPFTTYGKLDVSAGVDAVVTNALAIITLAVIALYCRECFVQDRPVRFGLLAALLIGVPLLRLHRSEVALGTLTLLAIYLFRPAATSAIRRGVAVSAGMALIVVSGIGFGILRENALQPSGSTAGQADRIASFLYSELSPVVVYNTTKMDIGGPLPYQYGSTLLLPFLTKVVPRNFVPDKPINSGAYFAEVYNPTAFAASFAIAPSLFGALLLNFGYVGCIGGVVIVGVLAARVDRIPRERLSGAIGWYVIAVYEFYPLLRNDLSDTLAILALTALVYVGLSRCLTSNGSTYA